MSMKKTQIYAFCYVQNMLAGTPTRIEKQIIKAYLLYKKYGWDYNSIVQYMLIGSSGFGFKRFMKWAKTSGYNSVAGNSSPTIRGNAHLDSETVTAIVKKDLDTYVDDWVPKGVVFSKERLDYSVPLEKYDIREPAPLYLNTIGYEYPSDVEGYEPVKGKEFIPYVEVYQTNQRIETFHRDTLLEKQCSVGPLDLTLYCEMLIITKHKERTTFFLTHDLEANYTFETLTAAMEENIKQSLTITVPEGKEPPDFSEMKRLLSYYDEVRAKFGEVAKDKTYIRVNWLDGPGGNPTNEVEYIVITSDDYDPEAQYIAYVYLLRNTDKVTITTYIRDENNEEVPLYTKSTLKHTNPKLLLGLMKYPTGIPEIDKAFNNQTVLGNDFAPAFSFRTGFWITSRNNYWGVQGCKRIYNDKDAYPRMWDSLFSSWNPYLFFAWLNFGIPITYRNKYLTAYKYSFWKHMWNTWTSQGYSQAKPLATIQDWIGYISFKSAYKEWHWSSKINNFGFKLNRYHYGYIDGGIIEVRGMSPDDDWQKYPQITKLLPRLSAGNHWIASYNNFQKVPQTVQLNEHIDSNTHSGASFWFQCSGMQLCQQLQWEYIQYGTGTDTSHKKGDYWERTSSFSYMARNNGYGIMIPNSYDYYRTEGTLTANVWTFTISSENEEKPYNPSGSNGSFNHHYNRHKLTTATGKWITYYHQISDDTYEYIRVKQPINLQFVFGFGWMIYDATSSNFLVPITYNSVRDMSLVKWTNASQWASNLKYTTFQSVKVWESWAGTITSLGLQLVGSIIISSVPGAIGSIIGATMIASAYIVPYILKMPASIEMQLLSKVVQGVFGVLTDVFGKVLGTIISLVIVIVITIYCAPAGASIWEGSIMGTASTILSCTAAVVNTYATLRMESIQKDLKKEENLNTSFKTLYARKQRQIEEAYKTNNIHTDAEHGMLVAEFWQYWQYKRNACSAEVETLDHFLNRTLMTGTEVAQRTLNNIYNFADGTLSVECDKPLILG